MSDWLKQTDFAPKDMQEIKSVSEHDPLQNVSDCNPISIRMNNYQKDILTYAAKKGGMKLQTWIRKTLVEATKKEGIF